MRKASTPLNQFGFALKRVRKATGLTQEDFTDGSGRTYISALERGLQSPTLKKVDELASLMGIHPLALLILAYVKTTGSSQNELTKALDDLESLGLQDNGVV